METPLGTFKVETLTSNLFEERTPVRKLFRTPTHVCYTLHFGSTVISPCSICSHFCIKTYEPLLCKSAKTLTAKQVQPPYGNETDYITKHLKSRSPSPKNLESLEFLPHCPFWLTVQLVLF